MAPRETPKAVSKVAQRTITKVGKPKSSPTSTVKKAMTLKKTSEKPSLKGDITNTVIELRQRTRTAPATPKPKENKPGPIPAPGSVTKSTKKSWKQRPKPAHSGIPLSSKMQKVFEQRMLGDL